VLLCHVQVKQSVERDEPQAGMQTTIRGGDYAAAKLAYGTFSGSDCRESCDFGHADLMR
jgi:hypothetical protein